MKKGKGQIPLKNGADKRLQNKEKYPLPGAVETEAMLNYTRRILLKNGYKPYYLYRQKNMVGSFENVGYYRHHPCLYNMEIMEEVISIFAFGAGGITKIVDGEGKLTRIENVKNAQIYIEKISEMIQRKLKYLANK